MEVIMKFREFKIDYEPEYLNYKYVIYRKDYIWFGFNSFWEKIGSFKTYEEAEKEIYELKSYPKYFSI